MIRFLVESAERYTFSCIYKILEKSIVQESYENLNKKENSLAVSYTHLDVYKIQPIHSLSYKHFPRLPYVLSRSASDLPADYSA